MKNTKIEWCDHTFNPWIGCTKISPACDNCYAERFGKRFGIEWGPGKQRKLTSNEYWKQPLRWSSQAEDREYEYDSEAPLYDDGDLAPYIRPRVFCGSLCDVFDDKVPVEWRWMLIGLIYRTPGLDWLLLTKRVGNMFEMIGDATMSAGLVRVPENIWLGVTICNQAEADEKIPILLQNPAVKRFISIEPMLSKIDLMKVIPNPIIWNPVHGIDRNLNWVICGGETGPGARPMHPDWVRSLRDQCQAAGVPFFFKSWGDYVPALQRPPGVVCKLTMDDRWKIIDGDDYFKVGKKAAGRLLDGCEWNEVPV